jgi:hypothetical protein
MNFRVWLLRKMRKFKQENNRNLCFMLLLLINEKTQLAQVLLNNFFLGWQFLVLVMKIEEEFEFWVL